MATLPVSAPSESTEGGLNRRDFLKALGLTGTVSMASACGFDQNYYRTPIEEVLPYVVRPDQIIPGNPVFFATTVTTGPNAYSVLARHREGRVVNVGANFRNLPADAQQTPGIPRAAFFELQRHYSPDRLRGPSSDGAAVEWDAALAKLAEAVKTAKKVAYIGPHRSGSIVKLLSDFTNGNAVFWEPLGQEAEAVAAERLFGQRVLPAYDLSKAQYVLSFGADFLGTWGTPEIERQYALARSPNHENFITRFGLVSPHRGQTGANADEWYAVTPGTEVQVAAAVAHLVGKKRQKESNPLFALVANVNPDDAAKAAGLTREQLDEIVARFEAGRAVALPGGVAGASGASVELAIATYVLNLLADNGGVTFGLGPVYAGPIHSYARVAQLIAEMDAGNIDVLLIDDHCNPVYALPASSGFAAAAAKVGMVVSLSSHANETTALAKLVLPTADGFEDWGDEEPAVGTWLLRQPSMSPVQGLRPDDQGRAGHDVRSLGDILLATARATGLGAAAVAPAAPAGAEPVAVVAAGAFDAPTWRDYVRARWEREVFPQAGYAGAFETWWTETLSNGVFRVATALVAPTPVTATLTVDAVVPQGDGEYFLIAYPHPFRYDGRYANEPWAQETADPMTGQVWDSWVEIHPDTAAKLGLEDNSLVEVTANGKTIRLGVETYPGVKSDTIAIAFGNGHTALGRYANGVGINVVELLAPKTGETIAWQSDKAAIKATGEDAQLVSTVGSDIDHRRGIGVVVSQSELGKVHGDAPAEEPGHLTGVAAHKLDDRLLAAGVTDFYGLTDHPTYHFGMTIDVNACNGCGVCAVACYAENNLPVVGKDKVREGREMAWLRVNRYWDDRKVGETGGSADVRFVPMLCQHCNHAPCESVCPVVATYHTIDGLNAMIYNRCVGTRYCANGCPYKVRRFNWHSYVWLEPFNFQLNPEVSTRTMGVMEKCTFCVQRIRAVKSAHRNKGFTNTVPDADLRHLPACVEACPSQALKFGNMNDESSVPTTTRKSARNYIMFPDLNTFPAINYLAKASFNPPELHHGGGHAAAGGEHGGHDTKSGEHHKPAEQKPAEHH